MFSNEYFDKSDFDRQRRLHESNKYRGLIKSLIDQMPKKTKVNSEDNMSLMNIFRYGRR